jgi:hypothetical protein
MNNHMMLLDNKAVLQDNHAMLSDIHSNVLAGQMGTGNRKQLVSTAFYCAFNEKN